MYEHFPFLTRQQIRNRLRNERREIMGEESSVCVQVTSLERYRTQ